jgi:hypothetical protein
MKKSFIALEPQGADKGYDAIVFDQDSDPAPVRVQRLYNKGQQSPNSKTFCQAKIVGHLNLFC